MQRNRSTTEACRQHSNDRLHKKREEVVRAGNMFSDQMDRIWENLKRKNLQSVVSTDDWRKSTNLLKIIFSRLAEISPPLASGLDDTLYELVEAKSGINARFVVLVNVKCLVNRLMKYVEETKFIMCFDPSIFWGNPSNVDDHFKTEL